MFYPVRIGEGFHDRYQVVAKLGWGAHSTIWLCHDLHDGRLRVLINTLIKHNLELEIYQHLNSPALRQSDHGGKDYIRELYDYFSVEGPHRTRDVFVMRPLDAAVRDLQQRMPDRVFDHEDVPDMLLELLLAIHFLHTEAKFTHTGQLSPTNTNIHTGNLLVDINNEDLFAKIKEDELRGDLCPRKDTGDRVIYTSKFLGGKPGHLYLCDVGNANLAGDNVRPAMPIQYRAPEIILGMEWGHSIDMWSVGMVLNVLAGVGYDAACGLFEVYDPEDEFMNDALHLAAMIALLGPPPRKWRGIVPIPTNRTFESLATKPEDKEERQLIINFVSALLSWLPEERLDSLQVYWVPADHRLAVVHPEELGTERAGREIPVKGGQRSCPSGILFQTVTDEPTEERPPPSIDDYLQD
ncbi:CMGC/SRPK protein kinase [Diaporthe helianthi]|uniref:non-specific serine/threonine protein kinase n=1 Tax=Diaporthe helianthi TaxID=158607 RepID=A0A2P5HR26_DIAHE|nr:CMGC/SRPK protein kinase [Diaporthe helianthi]